MGACSDVARMPVSEQAPGVQAAPAPTQAQATKTSKAQDSSQKAPLSIDSQMNKKKNDGAAMATFEPDSPKPPSGLAARRKMAAGLQVGVNQEKSMDKGEKLPGARTKKTIKVCRCFADAYTLGKEVMPSTHVGMDVLFAMRKSDGKEVVIKTRQKKSSFKARDEEEEWRRSTEMLMNLQAAEGIAQIYEVLEDPSTYYVVMEKVEGMDLFETLHSEKCIPLGEMKAILRQLLSAVQDLHTRGCIHKDLKLENIMVDKAVSPKTNGQTPAYLNDGKWSFPSANERSPTVVKLIDFDTVETYIGASNKATKVVGTDQYIAPEAYGGHYAPASDIFSCGVIAYRLVAGRFPFQNSMFDDEPGENWVGSPKMKAIQDRLKQFEIDFTIAPWPAEPKAKDLVRWMLQINEKERPTATQALEHQFLSEVTGKTPGLPQAIWGSKANGYKPHKTLPRP